MRSLNRKPSWKNKIISNISPILMPYSQGYGHQVPLDPKVDYIAVKKVIRGLHWEITKEVLPFDIHISMHNFVQEYKLDGQLINMFTRFGKYIVKCGNQFEVIHAIAEDSMHASAWLIRFYGEDCFLGFIRPTTIVDKLPKVPEGTSIPI